MPRPIVNKKILALKSGDKPTIFLTEDAVRYENAWEMSTCLLTIPHRERYDIRYVDNKYWEEQKGWLAVHVDQEEWHKAYEDLLSFCPWCFYNYVDFLKDFLLLWERGDNVWI